MSKRFLLEKTPLWNRRQLLKLGLASLGVTGTAVAVLEFAYPFTGKYMFHPHQDAIAETGCMGHFEVIAQT
jgi:FtsP/CotA-like multicopper oxidase with cupredoxin domain